MTKISTFVPDTEINGKDKLIGTDFNNAQKTKNFKVEDLGTHFNLVNGSRNFEYLFYNHLSISQAPADGAFYANGNEQDPNNITHFFISKKTINNKDVSSFFDSITAENPFDLIISQSTDLNTIFFFNISSVESISGYYKLTVSEVFFPQGKTMEFMASNVIFNLKANTESIHNNLDGLNDGDYQHLTVEEKEKFDGLPNTFVSNHSELNLDDGTNPHGTTKQDVGLSNVPNLNTTDAVNNQHTHSNKIILDNTTESFTIFLKTAYDNTVSWIVTNGSNLLNHLTNFSNPHNVTKSQVGLGNTDNTSDVNKPISIATQTALNLKANSDSPSFTGTVSGITATMVGAPSGSGNSTGTNTGDNATNSQYSGLVSNATHSGEVIGSTILTIDKTAITNKSIVTASLLDNILISDESDTGNLKKITVQSIIDLTTLVISDNSIFNFLNEEDKITNTILNTNITNSNIKSFSFIPIETPETSLDDFSLNGLSFSIANIIDNVSFDIIGTALNNASGNYTIKYLITI